MMARIRLLLFILLTAQFSYGQPAGTTASKLGIEFFIQHQYEAAAKTLEYAIGHAEGVDENTLLIDHVFLVHALCLTNDRKALKVLQHLTPLLQKLQKNTCRGDFPVEYADGMRKIMTTFLLPLTSLVSKTFPDQESLHYCFNLLLYLKQFAFFQLQHQTDEDIRNTLLNDYAHLIAEKLGENDVAIEFVPYMDVDGERVKGYDYAAYILDRHGKLTFVNVCSKKSVDALYHHNDSTWMLYAKGDDRLPALVWRKLEPLVTGKQRIYLAPSGTLNRVNFILFDDRIHELTTLCELDRRYAAHTNKNALLVGDVDYDRQMTDSTRGEREWGMLKGTKREIEAVASSLSATYTVTKLTQDSVCEEAVRNHCKQSPQILHFATHAICYTDSMSRSRYPYFNFPHTYMPEKPELSFTGLVLSGGNRGFMKTDNLPMSNDGIMLSEEIAKLPLNGTSLVVLSACNSASGIFDDIEGTIGMVKAFKLAGARTIIASLSKVDDDAACEFMTAFYCYMHQSGNIHTAFVNTIRDMKARYPDNPKNWAMFKMTDFKD